MKLEPGFEGRGWYNMSEMFAIFRRHGLLNRFQTLASSYELHMNPPSTTPLPLNPLERSQNARLRDL